MQKWACRQRVGRKGGKTRALALAGPILGKDFRMLKAVFGHGTLRVAFGAATLASAYFASPASAEDAIKIGSVVSATGPAAFLGDPEARTLKLYVEELNKKGGLLGRKVELVLYDDGGDANKARTFATRLVEDDHVVAVAGGTTTGVTMAIAPVFEEAKIPLVSLAGAIEIVDPVRPFVFKTPHTDKTACQKIFEDMKARGYLKIAMISGTDGFGKSMRAQCLKVVGDYGISVVADESYGATDSDMTPQIGKIRGVAGVQAVLNAGFGQGPAIVTRNYAQMAVGLPLYQSHGVASKSFIDLAGPASEGVRLPAPALLVASQLADNDPQKPVVTAYKASYEAATGQPVSTFGGYGFDGIQLVVEAIRKANSTDGQKIRDALEATKGYVGVTGVYTMSPTDHLGLARRRSACCGSKRAAGSWTPPPNSAAPMAEFLQLTFSGVTVGAIYALIALGFALIYNASDVINFAQGDFVMMGGMALGLPGGGGSLAAAGHCPRDPRRRRRGAAAPSPRDRAGARGVAGHPDHDHHRRLDLSEGRRADRVRQAVPYPAVLLGRPPAHRRGRGHPAAKPVGASAARWSSSACSGCSSNAR